MSDVQKTEPAPVPDIAEEFMVRMRDGTRLATDLYLPPKAAALGTVLVRLPYDKDGRYTFLPLTAPFFLDQGFAVVVQDVRGKFRSEGETKPYVHEITDAWDTLDWIGSQPWASGDVGMFGDSYYGWTQWAAVASRHPALKAIVPRVTATSLSGGLAGRWDRDIIPLDALDYFAHHWVDRFTYAFEIDWSHRPLVEVFDRAFAAIGARSAAVDAVMGRDGPIVDPFAELHPLDAVEIPVLHAGGWFDNIASAQMDDFLYVQNRRSRQFLWMDSSDHESYRLDDVPITGDPDIQWSDASIMRMLPGYVEPVVEFLRENVLGSASLGSRPRVRWHLGHVGWRTDEAWPPPGTKELRFALGRAGRSSRGRLLASGSASPSVLRWEHDPDDLVPSSISDVFSFLYEYPDERLLGERPDVLTFTSEPFERHVDIAGPIELTTELTATSPSLAIYAKVMDVSPDGATHQLVRGSVRVMGSEYGSPVRIALGHSGYRIRAGHSLEVRISASDFPLYLPDSGDGQNPWLMTSGVRTGISTTVGDPDRACLSIAAKPPDDED